MTKSLSLLLAVAALLAITPAAQAADPAAARRGATWLAKNAPVGGGGTSADTIVALRAAGKLTRGDAARRARVLRGGAGRYATTAGATAKVILGLAAANANARCAGRIDLLRRLQGFGRRGRYGRTVFDHALGMLAMRTLRAGPPRSTVDFLLRARGRGGWSLFLSRTGSDDVQSTAMAILALRAAGVSGRSAAIKAGISYMRAQRAPTGGFAMHRRDRTEANTTALYLQALRASGFRDSRAERALRSLQRGSGAFQFTRTDTGSQQMATVDSVVALSGRALPILTLRRTPGACR